jgi:CarD family transcriptional regulator
VLRASKDLSFGERRMLEQARSLLVRELALAKGVSEEKLGSEIDALFAAAAA